jgi:hypothetical protein
MSIARHHFEWLSLVPVSGPFLSLPVLMEAFNAGLERRNAVNRLDIWLSASLACNFVLVLLAVGSSLFLLRRLDQLFRARVASEERLIKLAFDVRKLERRLAQLESRGKGASAPAANAPSLIAVPELASESDGEGAEEDAATLARKHDEVWALVEAGRGLAEIASATGRPIGQVELIAGLHRQYQSSRIAGDHASAT